ncbi:hypothetical protein [Occallatibacter riparius]|uniref:Outer membrane protein beta-barrel domain-containing protein n=1 Tax=Occallatibacter riparius TaxID=1002689 RepID=A0A9J7BHU8_9BACT|nr:hypothetical protein [Occallatibacter riparius]UWZ82516.1 hypothetical protein MOP44_18290 [Occallatibacter riparius]
MRKLLLAGMATILALPLTLSSQVQRAGEGQSTYNHGEFAAYGDYFRWAPSGHSAVNFLGLGGRAAFNVHPHVAMEGEISYDFERNFTTINNSGGTTTTVVTGVRPLTGLFGPKFQVGTSGPFRAFLTAKAGFMEFSTSNKGPSTGTFTGAFDQFGGNSTHFAAYPGGGIEAFAGPFGLRLEAGDQIYVSNGMHNNLRVAVGPTIRF